jgi:hypothetical protein
MYTLHTKGCRKRKEMSDLTTKQLAELLQQGEAGRITRGHLQAFLRNPDSVFNGPPPVALSQCGGISIVCPELFIACDMMFGKRNKAQIDTGGMAENAKPLFFQKVEELPKKTEVVLNCYTLSKGAVDAHIITALGGEARASTSLASAWGILEKQPKGEEGILLTDGKANVFYISDTNGVLRTLSMEWWDHSWKVDASPVELLCDQPAGTRVFSPKLRGYRY